MRVVAVHPPLPEGQVGDFAVEADQGQDTPIERDLFEIGANLVGARKVAGPLRVRRKAVGIGVRRDIASQAGIAVFAPGAPEPVGLFQHDHVLMACLAQPDRRENARHAGPDHQKAQFPSPDHVSIPSNEAHCRLTVNLIPDIVGPYLAANSARRVMP